MRPEFLRRLEGLALQIADNRSLKRCDQIQRFAVAKRQNIVESGASDRAKGIVAARDRLFHAVDLDIAQNGCFDAAEGEEKARQRGTLSRSMHLGFHLRKAEGHGACVAVAGQTVDPWAAGIP